MILPQQIVTSVVEELKGRTGFDHWWDDIDEEIQVEILNTLEEIVTKEIDQHNANAF